MRKGRGDGTACTRRLRPGAGPGAEAAVTSDRAGAPTLCPPPHVMRLSLLTVLTVVALAGCRSSGPPPYLPGDALGTRVESIQIPDGYTVQTASFGLAYATDVGGGTDVNGIGHAVTSSYSEQPFVNVYAVEAATGQEVLLVYALGRRRDPVLRVELDARGAASRAAR